MTLQQIERFKQRALASSPDDKFCRNCIVAADMLVRDLEDAGLISPEDGLLLRREWVQSYSAERIAGMDADEQLKALWQRQGGAAMFLPDGERVRLIREQMVGSSA